MTSSEVLKALATRTDAPVAVVDLTRADHYARATRADRTWTQYRSAFRLFADWCAERGLSPMPAAAVTLRAYVAWLADQGRTVATINAYVAAIASAHSIANEPFDRSALKDDLKGIRKDKPRKPRQARPLVTTDLKAILGDFGEEAIDVRDRLLLTLGFAGALRRSELVGLDWQHPGDGTGFMSRDERGIAVTLLRSKAGNGELVEVIIPCSDMPAACAALEVWVARAKLNPGEPVFRPINKGGEIGTGRLGGRSVALVIKARVRERALAVGQSEADADALAELCSGHSLRAGYCTAAALAGTPEWKIRRRSRHKTAELVARYVRAAEQWTDSGLKNIGF